MSLWADTSLPQGGFGHRAAAPQRLDAVERLKDWTRSRFGLQDDETIVVAESTPTLPGFPPLVTGIAFWAADGTRYHFRVFKGVEEVGEHDIPPAWMMSSLAGDGFDCDCC